MRINLKAKRTGAVAFAICLWLCACGAWAASNRVELNLNDGWHFKLASAGTNSLSPDAPESVGTLNDSKWENVFLPHTPRIESPEKAEKYFQGICWYRRQIQPDKAWRGKKVSVLFEGAMQIADISGKAHVIGPSQVPAEAGIATVLVSFSDLRAGRITIRAKAADLKAAGLELSSTRLTQP